MLDLLNETSTKLLTISKNVLDIVLCDLWTSNVKVSLLTVTCHFVHDHSMKTAYFSTRKLLNFYKSVLTTDHKKSRNIVFIESRE